MCGSDVPVSKAEGQSSAGDSSGDVTVIRMSLGAGKPGDTVISALQGTA